MLARKSHDLHGNAPDKCAVALLLIDTINDLEFDGGKQFLKQLVPMAKRIAKLKSRCLEANIPTIYVNDNFGRWRSDFKTILNHCMTDDVAGKPVVKILYPHENDYFVLKPKHSGFFSSALSTLLEYLEVESLILTGITTDICVLFTANDAYMRDYRIIVPADCVAAKKKTDNKSALHLMKRVLKADTTPSVALNLPRLKRY